MTRSLRLHPDARPARRGPGEVQFGLFPDCGVVLTGLTEHEADLMLALRESLTERELVERARRHGVPRPRVEEALTLLRTHGVLTPDVPPPPERPATRVAVQGRGPLAEQLRRELPRSGAHIQTDGTTTPPDLIVRVARGALPLPRAAELPETVPLVPVVVRATGVVIGPVLGAWSGPCLSCLELHRRDRDRARPHILAQVAAPGPDGVWWDDAGLDPGLVSAATGLTCLVLASLIAGPAPPRGLSWELSAPWPEVVKRQWNRHPACRCATVPSAAGVT